MPPSPTSHTPSTGVQLVVVLRQKISPGASRQLATVPLPFAPVLSHSRLISHHLIHHEFPLGSASSTPLRSDRQSLNRGGWYTFATTVCCCCCISLQTASDIPRPRYLQLTRILLDNINFCGTIYIYTVLRSKIHASTTCPQEERTLVHWVPLHTTSLQLFSYPTDRLIENLQFQTFKLERPLHKTFKVCMYIILRSIIHLIPPVVLLCISQLLQKIAHTTQKHSLNCRIVCTV